MNIRKKILFNPSNIKSAKPGSSDNTTANTKNSAILEQSKALQLPHNQPFSSHRSKNYLRTLSKELKKQNSPHIHNIANSAVNKINHLQSFSTISNQNFQPIKKAVHGRKFAADYDDLPPLVPQKRPNILSSQNERKIAIFPNSHINSNKDLHNPRDNLKKQSLQRLQIPVSRILGGNMDEIERRKQQLNSVTPKSFYTTHKSIALSKFSMGSRQSNRIQNFSKNSDHYPSIQKQNKQSQFICQKQKEKTPQKEITPEIDVGESLEESIVQEIERHKTNHQMEQTFSDKKESQIENSWNQQTLKSSFTESRNENDQKRQDKSNTQSSLCESEEIDEQQLQEKKKTCRLRNSPNNVQKTQGIQRQRQSFLKNVDFKEDRINDEQQSSLCQSYQIETPVRTSKE